MMFRCVCTKPGWVRASDALPDAWAEACPKCKGDVCIGTCELARALELDHRDVSRVAHMQAGRRVASRVLDAIAKHFPEALA